VAVAKGIEKTSQRFKKRKRKTVGQYAIGIGQQLAGNLSRND